ncbi:MULTISPECIES: metalloregulator ArsR/SmtB family transcription factor [unclassified Brenneria]|uniref:ArsR/SmtB family transcription factor n=1 Tax=unclassified Brenneria TaxID=2634434 RepID=UPI0029C31E94|nr:MULTISPECIES: metalloregulator ArsR/SmtB family transcription factor [unclassified Brenneria]MDX5628357.1 metalloregulator ArsR/SmtB family transcription factor [Brenneria sp. L3-3Z]MDX5695460.1 metalloregulator ArsR/SmtB family transcription factor [Brenneria sp. L4-2C]MEE3662309.1 metalloregulator ArsR/SmtB family transcription factor [Brenneria sp. g21c3]
MITETQCEEMAALLRLLGHPIRLHIALLLHQQPQTVSALETQLNIRQPNLSQHLAVLREAGLVYATREAKSVTYAVSDELPARLMARLAALLVETSVGDPVDPPPQADEPVYAHHQGDELVFATVRFPRSS